MNRTNLQKKLDAVKEQNDFVINHKTFTFIIENKLFREKYGVKNLNLKESQYIFALSKWIVDIYNAFEQIYYNINNELTLIIEDNLLFYFENTEEYKSKNNEWQKYMTHQMYSY